MKIILPVLTVLLCTAIGNADADSLMINGPNNITASDGSEYKITDRHQDIDGPVAISSFLKNDVDLLQIDGDQGAEENTTGIWSLSTSNSTDYVNIISVKGPLEYSLCYVDSALQASTLTTAHFQAEKNDNQQPALSNFFITTTSGTTPDAPNPESATLLFFGTGLVGFAGLRNKIFKRGFDRV